MRKVQRADEPAEAFFRQQAAKAMRRGTSCISFHSRMGTEHYGQALAN
jgi:hypothetical protein